MKRPELLFEVVIPGRVGIKKNSRRIFKNDYGQTKNIPSVNFKNWESVAIAFVHQAMRKQRLLKPIEGPVSAYFEFHFKNQRALPDVSNCVEGPQDVLQAVGVLQNDRQIDHVEAKRAVCGVEQTIVKLFKRKEKK